MLKEIREALKTEVALVRPIRIRIRESRKHEKYAAWEAKRERSHVRRHLHLAACYMRGTPYRKCEAEAPQPSVVWLRDLLAEHGCTEDPYLSLDAWLDMPPNKVEKPSRVQRLYVVVRADLPPGAQAVQAAHAMREFAEKYPEVEKAWHAASNTVAFLSVPDEDALDRLQHQLPDWLCVATFREFDLSDALTAICVEPKGGKFLRHLPLALRGEKAA